jgi:Holliday junction resolvase RusA-like endonuclease
MELWIPGRPLAYPRPAQDKHGNRYTPTKFRDWKDASQWDVLAQRGRAELLKGPVRLAIQLERAGMQCIITPMDAVDRHGLTGDIDNYAKSVMDILQGPILENDRQVAHLEVHFG